MRYSDPDARVIRRSSLPGRKGSVGPIYLRDSGAETLQNLSIHEPVSPSMEGQITIVQGQAAIHWFVAGGGVLQLFYYATPESLDLPLLSTSPLFILFCNLFCTVQYCSVHLCEES